MPNPYVNKVVQSNGTTLIDISDTTAVAADVASGKYFYLASGEKVAGTSSGGGTPAISVVDTVDSHGGTIREITALDISDTTATAPDVAQGKYFYTAQGVKTAGTASGGGSSVQTVTGTVSGSGSIVLQIPCDFAPDLICVYGDMTGDASLRGCVSFTIMKDTYLEATVDGSSNNTDEFIWWKEYNITGYSGDVSMPHGEYTSGNVILNMVENSSSLRFNSAVTYTYKFIKWT